MEKMERVVIFCDGANKGNPGPGGWAALVVAGDRVTELGGAEKHTTNNRMELTAALEALRASNSAPAGPRVVYTDSAYVINGITRWVHGWKKNGWQTKEKKTVVNQDLWRELDAAALASGSKIDWHYVGGHVGVAGNERVDQLASDLAEGKKVKLYKGALMGYGIDVANLGADEGLKAAKSVSSTRSKAKAHSYISSVDGTVMVHKTWKECEARVRGRSARFKKALSASEEKEIIAEFSKK